LLEQGQQVGHAPVLDDLAVPHPHGVDRLEVDLPTGGGDAEEQPLVGAMVGLVGRDEVAVGGLPVDLGMEVGERLAQQVVELPSAGLIRGPAGLRRVVEEVVGEELLEELEVSLTLDGVAPDDGLPPRSRRWSPCHSSPGEAMR
jgi:hypothetical protein